MPTASEMMKDAVETVKEATRVAAVEVIATTSPKNNRSTCKSNRAWTRKERRAAKANATIKTEKVNTKRKMKQSSALSPN